MATDLRAPANNDVLEHINKYDFVTPTVGVFKARKGLNADQD